MLDAASRLADRTGGGPGASMQVGQIAAEAGVAVGTLYQYFTGVDDVIDAVVRRHLERFRELIVQTFDNASIATAADASVAVVDAFVDYYRVQPGFRSIWFGMGHASRLRALEVANHEILSAVMYDELTSRGLMPDSSVARIITITNWELADSLVGLAFRRDPNGDEATLVYARHLISLASQPTLEVIVAIAEALPSTDQG